MRALSQGVQALGSGAPVVSACAEGVQHPSNLSQSLVPITHQLNQ